MKEILYVYNVCFRELQRIGKVQNRCATIRMSKYETMTSPNTAKFVE